MAATRYSSITYQSDKDSTCAAALSDFRDFPMLVEFVEVVEMEELALALAHVPAQMPAPYLCLRQSRSRFK